MTGVERFVNDRVEKLSGTAALSIAFLVDPDQTFFEIRIAEALHPVIDFVFVLITSCHGNSSGPVPREPDEQENQSRLVWLLAP